MRPILPCLKEKKRYLAFEIISKSKINAFSQVSKAIWNSVLSLVGESGAGAMGLWVLPEKYSDKKQKGIIRANNRWLEALKASLGLIIEIEKQPVIVRSLGASGILQKAEEKYIK